MGPWELMGTLGSFRWTRPRVKTNRELASSHSEEWAGGEGGGIGEMMPHSLMESQSGCSMLHYHWPTGELERKVSSLGEHRFNEPHQPVQCIVCVSVSKHTHNSLHSSPCATGMKRLQTCLTSQPRRDTHGTVIRLHRWIHEPNGRK